MTPSVNSDAGQETFNLCLGEFGKIGDSEEELADAVQQGEAIGTNCLKPLWTQERPSDKPAIRLLFSCFSHYHLPQLKAPRPESTCA